MQASKWNYCFPNPNWSSCLEGFAQIDRSCPWNCAQFGLFLEDSDQTWIFLPAFGAGLLSLPTALNQVRVKVHGWLLEEYSDDVVAGKVYFHLPTLSSAKEVVGKTDFVDLQQ